MKTAKLFPNGNSQAVRLPKEFSMAGDEVYIKKSGNMVILIPLKGAWDNMISAVNDFSDDFMADRQQPEMQQRETF
jgi:antitoxin VapB